MFKRLFCWAYFWGSLFSEGLIIGRNFEFQNGLDLTIKTASSNSPWAYVREGLLSEGYLRLWFGRLIFRRAYFCGGLLSEFYGILFHCFILFSCGGIHQGHKMFSDESRGRQEIYFCLAALLVLIFADSWMEVWRNRSALVRRSEVNFLSTLFQLKWKRLRPLESGSDDE